MGGLQACVSGHDPPMCGPDSTPQSLNRAARKSTLQITARRIERQRHTSQEGRRIQGEGGRLQAPLPPLGVYP